MWKLGEKGGRKMRRKAYVVLALLAVVALAFGCGKETADREGITLTVWQTYSNEEQEVFRTFIEEFEQANPDIKVETVNIPFDGMEPKILTSLATETAPDIGRVDVAFLPKLAIRGALHPLDAHGAREIKDEIRPVAMGSCLIDGKIYGIPDQVNGLCLFYNKDLFRDAGLDPEKPPQDWEEFVKYAQQITDREKGIFGFGMRNSLWWSLPFIYSFGGDFLTPDMKKCALTSDEAVAGFQFKVDLYSKYNVEGGAWRSGGIRDDMGFQNRKYAMIFNGPWATQGLAGGGIDFGVALVPAGPAGRATNVGGNNLVVFSTSEHPAEACRFMMFVASKESQAKWANVLGQIPVNVLSDDLVDHTKHPYLKVFMEQMKYARARPPVGSYPEIENDTNPEMQAALDGKKTVRAAMESACEKISKIIEEEAKLKATFQGGS
jgi:ABC-type glycerol-3-phosphate transport system substrate-binding protein